jgi:GGDEF domain-containing protein
VNGLPPNLYLAALGPLTELLGVVLIVVAFALLRSQADRRPYFKTWERSWGFLALALIAGLIYERYVDPDSLFYPASPTTTWLLAVAFLAFRLMAAALVLNGAQLYTRGLTWKWSVRAMPMVAVGLAFLADTTRVPLAPLATLHAPVILIASALAAWYFIALPPSRRSAGTRYAALAFVLQALLAAALAAFYLVKRGSPSLTTNPWLIRFARYAFYTDLLLQFTLAWAMVRLLLEDGRREANDIRAHLKLVQDRDKLGELYDDRARLLARRAFDAKVGLDFARASFGSVAYVKVTNFERVTAQHGIAIGEALISNIAGVLDSAVRAHDRVYRWSQNELLVVMPRAIPSVARARVEYLTGRAAALTVSGLGEPLRTEVAVAVRPFSGGEDLAEAAAAASTL